MLPAAEGRAIRLDDLPDTLRDVAERIGLPATLALVERWGGIRVFVPRADNLGDAHPLAQALGMEAARRLAEYCDGSEIAVPRAANALRRLRDEAIRAGRGEIPAARLAREHGLTERQIYAIWSTESVDDGQAALF